MKISDISFPNSSVCIQIENPTDASEVDLQNSRIPLSKDGVDFSVNDDVHCLNLNSSKTQDVVHYSAFFVFGMSVMMSVLGHLHSTSLALLCGGSSGMILARKVVKSAVMTCLDPLSNIFGLLVFRADTRFDIYSKRIDLLTNMNKKNDMLLKEIVLEKNGIRYSGMTLSHKDNVKNGRWIVHAPQNLVSIEQDIEPCLNAYGTDHKFNILMVNRPGVGESEGDSNPVTMGDSIEVALSFIETVHKAHTIVISGRSLGGAVISQAILQHDFKENIKYFVVREMTFNRTEDVCEEWAKNHLNFPKGIISKVIPLIGLSMNSVEASRKLARLGIRDIVIQSTNRKIPQNEKPKLEDFKTDGVIEARASLGYALVREGIAQSSNVIIIGLRNANHSTSRCRPKSAALISQLTDVKED